MPGAILVSDDYWLLGARFARWIDTDYKPEGVGVENLKPESISLDNFRPVSQTAVETDGVTQFKPRSAGAQSLRPRASATNMRPQSRKAEEI